MIMQSDNSHHEAHQNDLNYSSEYQYDMYPDSTCKCNGWFRVGLF